MNELKSDLHQQLRLHTRTASSALAKPVDGLVQCLACSHRCNIGEGGTGVCNVRFNDGGEIRAPWGWVSALMPEPIEKKPFFHVRPGGAALTFGMQGCNLRCGYCQNWVVSQALRDADSGAAVHVLQPEDIARAAEHENAVAVVASYNEPLVSAEWCAGIFGAVDRQQTYCGVVSNGSGTPEVLRFLRPVVDLFKIDLKAFSQHSYSRLGGSLRSVLDSIGWVAEMGFWLEVVTPVVPGFNDSVAELQQMARFLASISQDIPWHVTAFQPDYRMNREAGYACVTPAETLLTAREIGHEAGLRFVYAGNLAGRVGDAEHTFCPNCHQPVVNRRRYRVLEFRLAEGCCPDCGERIPGHWSG